MALPSGTVTFLFTDIEGSTKLSQTYHDQWETMRARHHAILHKAVQDHNGHVFQIIGDEFCVAFHTAIDAVRAAADAQRMLFTEPWDPAPIKVRMGIHSGTAHVSVADDQLGGYTGYIALARVSRLRSAGHGGQVLVSLSSEELVRDELPEEIGLRDLGARRLKDLNRPEQIFQLILPGLPVDFPPLKTLDANRHNLPIQLTSFIGREKAMGQIAQSIGEHRLVTLTGVGGSGKTRLALHVAAELIEQFGDGVWFVDLAPVSDPELIPQTIITAMGINEQQGRTIQQILIDYFREKKLLLILDNCEHLIQASAKLADLLLNNTHSLKILATSREVLGVTGEVIWHVPSLSLPDAAHLTDLEHLTQYEAVRLFIDRALLVQPGFYATNENAVYITQICSRLDGIPLAIELAAARVRAMSIDQIATRIDDRFRLLTGGSRTALERHQTLRATLDWSYNLLTEEEKILLRSLAVFSGGWTLEAAESICAQDKTGAAILDLLTQLVDKSLVNLDNSRYHMLETIRQYAREKLVDGGGSEQIHARHLEYFITLAQKGKLELHGPNQYEWSQKLEAEYENFRAALEWSMMGNISAGQELAIALWWSWEFSGYLSEGYQWLGKMLAATPLDETTTRAHLLAGAGWLAEMIGINHQIVIDYSQASVDLFRKNGDEAGAAFPLATLARRAFFHSDYDWAISLAEESWRLFINSGNKWGVCYSVTGLGWSLLNQGKIEEAKQVYEEALSFCNEVGHHMGRSRILFLLAETVDKQGERARAVEYCEEALKISRPLGNNTATSVILCYMGEVLLQLEDYARSQSIYEDVLKINQDLVRQPMMTNALLGLGGCAIVQGDSSKASSYYREGLQLIQKTGNDELIAVCLLDIGTGLERLGHPEKFARLLGVAQNYYPEIIDMLTPSSNAKSRKAIESARTALGEEAYNAAYIAGSQLRLDEAVADTLKVLGQ